MKKERFFGKYDWIAAGVAFLVSLVVYVYTMAPTVTLEDSGELVVASDYLGVPHPPGYPIWSLMTWFFQWVFHSVTYHGHPNPAWAVNLFSAVAGAAACGGIALLISRSGIDLLHSIKKESLILDEKTERMFGCCAGITGALMLAFAQSMWSQSVIAEVYSLNIFFQTLVLIFLYRWMTATDEPKWMYLCCFMFGLGITNHQTLMFMGLALAIAILFRNIGLFRDFAIVGICFLAMVAFNRWATTVPHLQYLSWYSGPSEPGFWIWSATALLIPTIAIFTLPNGKIVGFSFLLLIVGLSFNGYMPFSSDQNPPINWGYPRTWKGFMHAITRGQYQRVVLANVLGDPAHFIEQVKALMRDLSAQFFLPVVLLGFLPFTAWKMNIGGKRLNGFLAATGLLIYASALYFFSRILAPGTPALAASLSALAGPAVLLMFLLFWLGFSLAIFNFIEHMMQECKRIWDSGSAWEWINLIMLLLIKVAVVLVIAAIDFMLLKNVITQAAENGFTANVTILAVVILPPLFLLAAYVLKKGTASLRFDVNDLGQHWFITTIVAFVSVSVIFLILHNPQIDIQNLFIGRTQYIQSHAIYAIWLGYGLLLIMAYLEALVKNNPVTRYAGTILVLLLPLMLLAKNRWDNHQLKVVGGCEQNGHDFGWQFGNWQLQGAIGIKEDLQAELSSAEFEQAWAEFPNPEYPPPMETNAIFFGGTDPGRFVPTYMIYSGKVRQDIYLITQNALADYTYMNVMRDLYGDQIWIPSERDGNRAFQEYIDAIRSGKIKAGADVAMKDGKVSVQGVGGVMKINAILSRKIFDHNQYITETKTDEATRPTGSALVPADPEPGNLKTRSFYVEESYVLQWMYPYLTPHGLIMKLNNKPTPLTPEMVKNDHEFWDWYCDRLLNDEKFIRDIVARKTFSKLRSALAGLYLARNNHEEAEYAFRQAVDLYTLSPEANFRLADLLTRQQRFEEAMTIIQELLMEDENNVKAEEFLNRIAMMKVKHDRMLELEPALKSGNIQFTNAVELINLYYSMGRVTQADNLSKQLMSSKGLTAEMATQLAQNLANARRPQLVEQALGVYVKQKPNDPQGWLNLAVFQLAVNKQAEAFSSMQRSIQLGGEPVRTMIRKDPRFNAIRGTPQYQKLVPPPAGANVNPFGLNPLQGM